MIPSKLQEPTFDVLTREVYYDTKIAETNLIMCKKVKFSHSLIVVGAEGVRVPLMKGGAHPFLFAALAFFISKKVPIHYWVDRQSFPVVAWRSLASNSQPYGDFLHHNRATLTTRPRRLSDLLCVPSVKKTFYRFIY